MSHWNSPSDNGKGSRRRTGDDNRSYRDNYDSIFRKPLSEKLPNISDKGQSPEGGVDK